MMMLIAACRGRVSSQHKQVRSLWCNGRFMFVKCEDVCGASPLPTRLQAEQCRLTIRSEINPILQHCIQRSFVTSTKALNKDDLPYHLVVGMPALSPTMESGVLAEWSVPEGGEFSAGDVLAEIQTDKASVAFEAQDDGYIAKHLIEAGTECQVGDPIMVTVEEEDYVSAFKDFVAPAKAEEAATPTAEAPAPPSPVPEPKPVSEEKLAAAKAEPPAPKPAAAAPPPPSTPTPPAPEVTSAGDKPTTLGPAWGSFARTASPLANHMSTSQQAYIDLYGSTGQQSI